ncbi:polymer-forming cytoskeletal protein [Luteimonas sp. 50]|uniref:Polymer-forming cytoskeletal protein n=1 Tax=Cognatiluteimonas sedimenti TaxID=2927791 RepID=A0ABT0A0I2_9GAMM|nr:polymer-forming cytoskeletal protein [Lysobacter sedimenti]MCJ0824484.1 polymer-forming cytoskeletal protein [Lysobacter sedimenti]
MAIFNPQSTAKKDAAPFTPDPPPFRETPAATSAGPGAIPESSPAPRRDAVAAKESLIAADLTIEGKIEGSGHVRIAGKFKGDVNVQGDLTIEPGAKLTGGVRAKRVVIAGELEGNIEGAAQVELQQGGVLVGDVKAGSLTVAAGSRMRGQADFGWEDKASKPNGNGESSTLS